ncbi:MAG TPA: CDP-alcohol phosphatidyltransferase family protein [Symbiobacteriaceae bacterium]|nr:CDP-alcohol phosphatidyltransferase family protein [Symbiobacteriaceae bacterium]
MLDTHVRRYINPVFEKTAELLVGCGLCPNQVTAAAMVCGVATAPLVAAGRPWGAVALLWLSGLLDAVDGQMARRLKCPTAWGTFLDITFDRVVEGAVLVGLGLRDPARALPLLVLAVSFILSLTVFLTTGILVKDQPTKKSFYYQAGIMERTEGFLAFTALILFPAHGAMIAYVAAALVGVTICQRILEVRRFLAGA